MNKADRQRIVERITSGVPFGGNYMREAGITADCVHESPNVSLLLEDVARLVHCQSMQLNGDIDQTALAETWDWLRRVEVLYPAHS